MVNTSAHGKGPAREERVAGATRKEAQTKDFLVESDVIIDFLKGVEGAKSALERAADSGVLRVSAVSAAEVMAASSRSSQEATGSLLGSFGVVPVDKEVALLAGLLLSDGARDEFELGDCIVAAACSKLGAVLVTRGKRRYPEIDLELQIASYE